MTRISFDKYHAAHFYELAYEHLCLIKNDCHTCRYLQQRIEKFLGKKETESIKKLLKNNGYCKNKNRLKL